MFNNVKEFVMKRINGKREFVPAPRLLKPGEVEDVIAIRDDDLGLQRYTNISWTTGEWHPDCGHEWGYSGQGPTDFARNILAHFTGDQKFAWDHEIEFRERFVRILPRSGGRIKREDILAFIAEMQNR